MPKYNVTLPFAGAFFMTIEADSAEDAIEKAQNVATPRFNFDDPGIDQSLNMHSEWDTYEKLGSGNVVYTEYNEAEAELSEEDQDGHN